MYKQNNIKNKEQQKYLLQLGIKTTQGTYIFHSQVRAGHCQVGGNVKAHKHAHSHTLLATYTK